jgi:chemotaxis protein methyltransferase CheR
MRALSMDGFSDYIEFVKENPEEFTRMVDSLSTNFTTFFREPGHFEFLKQEILPRFKSERKSRIRLWSAGCSSGEEPYSIAMLLRECIPDLDIRDCKILATDISTRMLQIAARGEYSGERLAGVPAHVRARYFDKNEQRGKSASYRAGAALRRTIAFRYLNLMEPWPIKRTFDVIFCRNVMIYFDRPTQQRLINRFYEALEPGGIFLIGHSESMVGISHNFQYVESATYRKPVT